MTDHPSCILSSTSKREANSSAFTASSEETKEVSDHYLDALDEEYETSLRELINTESLKWIFVGGKGGVGKTTTSCAIAVELSKHRKNVLILSTDPAHNLSDAFNQKFCETATLVNGFKNLYGMEIDSHYEKSLAFSVEANSSSLSFSFMNMLPEILQAFPGVDEALSFAELMRSVQTMGYSVIVFDTAPTGHTLRLLSFPDLLESSLNKLTQIKEQMSTAISMLNTFSGTNSREDDIITKMENLKAITTSVKETFQDPSRTTFVCVCIPEFLSVFETERLVQELAKQNIDCSNIVVNQVLFPMQEDSEEVSDNDVDEEETHESHAERKKKLARMDNEKEDFFAKENEHLKIKIKELKKKLHAYQRINRSRRKMQSKYLMQIMDLYSNDFHVVCVPQQAEEVRGVDSLKKFVKLLLQPKKAPILLS